MSNKKPDMKPLKNRPSKMRPLKNKPSNMKPLRNKQKPRSARAVSADYRGQNQPRRRPVKTSGLSKAMKGTIHGKKPWN